MWLKSNRTFLHAAKKYDIPINESKRVFPTTTIDLIRHTVSQVYKTRSRTTTAITRAPFFSQYCIIKMCDSEKIRLLVPNKLFPLSPNVINIFETFRTDITLFLH